MIALLQLLLASPVARIALACFVASGVGFAAGFTKGWWIEHEKLLALNTAWEKKLIDVEAEYDRFIQAAKEEALKTPVPVTDVDVKRMCATSAYCRDKPGSVKR